MLTAFFLIFPRKQVLTFHADILQENVTSLLSAELAPRAVKVKDTADCFIKEGLTGNKQLLYTRTYTISFLGRLIQLLVFKGLSLTNEIKQRVCTKSR